MALVSHSQNHTYITVPLGLLGYLFQVPYGKFRMELILQHRKIKIHKLDANLEVYHYENETGLP